MDTHNHQHWMEKAIELARTSWGHTHPNPMVGAILVHNNEIITSGYHEKAGEFHAERAALTGIQLTAIQKEQATLYITLEPCSTHGRTPPCTEIIREKGIKHVVVGALDPNPLHQGRGIDLLKKHGIHVETGIMEAECSDLNLIFNHCIKDQSPFIALKSAMTLDGKIATKQGYSKWITGDVARENVMHWRGYFPAIGVGAGTALSDNPSLTIRRDNRVIGSPIRFIFDRSLRTINSVDSLNVYNDAWVEKTVLVTSNQHPSAELQVFENKGCQICQLDYKSTSFPVSQFKSWCWKRDITGIYIEGGPSLSSSFINQRAVDYLFIYHAPKLFISNDAPSMASGGDIETPSEAPFIESPKYEVFGNDILSRGPLSYNFG